MFIPGWMLIIGAGIIAYFLWRNRPHRKPQFAHHDIPISPEVVSKEISTLFADTLLDKQARPIFLPLFKAGNGYVTWREIMFMKFLLRKICRDTMIAEMETHKNDSYHDAAALNQQVKTLASALKADDKGAESALGSGF